MKPVALYVHIPFCVKKCAYCDFRSWPGRERDWARYLNALEDEFASAARRYGKMPVKTAFIAAARVDIAGGRGDAHPGHGAGAV